MLGRCRAAAVFFACSGAALGVARPCWANEADPFPARGFVYTGLHYGYGMGERADFDSFQYLTLGGGFDHPYLHVSIETPLPYVIVDGIVGIIAALAGEDLTIPLFEAMNGDREAGRIRVFDLQASARFARWGSQALEAGLRADMSMLQAYVGDDRKGSSVFDLGPTFGYVVSREDVWLRVVATGGAGFGAETDGNPFVGAIAQGMILVQEPIGIFVRSDAMAQHLDLRDPSPSPGIRNDIVEWAGFGTTLIGVAGMF